MVSEPSSFKTSHKIASSVISGLVLMRESCTETISLAVVPSRKNLGYIRQAYPTVPGDL